MYIDIDIDIDIDMIISSYLNKWICLLNLILRLTLINIRTDSAYLILTVDK